MEGVDQPSPDGNTVELKGSCGGRGGDVTLSPGHGGAPEGGTPGCDGNIIFNTPNGSEMMRVSSDGFYVRGVKVPQDEHEALAVYTQFKLWLATATVIASPPPEPSAPNGIETDGTDS